MIRAEIADIDIRRDGALLWPGVQAHVGFGQEHRGGDPARPTRRGGKGVEQLIDRLQPDGSDGPDAPHTKAARVGQPGRVTAAPVEISGQV